jgi:hypothetical protein
MPIIGDGQDMCPQPFTYNGINGYFTVPSGWYMMPAPGCLSEFIVSPNADFSYPTYYAGIAHDGMTLIFRDLPRAVETDTLGTNARITI